MTEGPLRLDQIRACLEGAIPAGIATCDPDGMPNVTYISQVHYVDNDHVALSYQFFNKTRRNIIANPIARLQLIDPITARTYRLTTRYIRTEAEGPTFESMKAKLAGIASHTGMSGVFRLLGADICRVLSIDAVPGPSLPPRERASSLLPGLRQGVTRLAQAPDLSAALDATLDALCHGLSIGHAAILLLDRNREVLYTVASHGYETSGIGSEIPVGQGVIGVAAREGTPIRITHMTSDTSYARTVREGLDPGIACTLESEIPLPGLQSPGSQLATPIQDGRDVHGVLFVEDEADMRFGFEDEDALAVLATQLGAILRRASRAPQRGSRDRRPAPAPPLSGDPIDVRHYRVNDIVFVGDEYLIKGVAGAILWRLLSEQQATGRIDFTNRELRLDPALRLPAHAENLEARLILLERRLAEKKAGIGIEKTARGQFRLRLDRPVRLTEMQVRA